MATVRTVSPDAVGIKATARLLRQLALLAGEGQPAPAQADDFRKCEIGGEFTKFLIAYHVARREAFLAWLASLYADLAARRKRIEDLWAHYQQGVHARDLRLEQEQAAQLAPLAGQGVDRARRRRSAAQIGRSSGPVPSPAAGP
jgi:hypothetical protein